MKITPSETTILHAVLSVAVATLIGASTAATQFYFNHGQDLWLSLAFFAGSLPATFATLRYAVWHAIQTNPALPQAEKDVESALAQEASQTAQEAHVKIDQIIYWLQQHMQGHAPSQSAGITKPEWMQQLSQSSTSVAPPTSTQQAGSVPMTTLPGMPAIPTQQ